MKVSAITFLDGNNYGCSLQGFATQEKILELGCEFEFLRYSHRNSRGFKHLAAWGKNNPVKMAALFPSYLRQARVFEKFMNRYLRLSDGYYQSEADFAGYEPDADIYCTGSDQVWNGGLTGGVETPFYLSFLPPGVRRISFAASFGKERLTDAEVDQTKRFIGQYERISVREDSGVAILKEQYGYRDAVQIADPTLTLPPKFWRARAPENRLKQPYILVYCLHKNPEFENYISELSKKTGIRLVRLCTRYDQAFWQGESVIIPEVFEFITLIDNAAYVVTDSFHGTTYSMALNTQPICVFLGHYSERLASFLRLTESEHRRIKDFQDFGVLDRPVDFTRVNAILERERGKADEFLRSILNPRPITFTVGARTARPRTANGRPYGGI